jgi:hypothetical protein
MIEAQKKLLFPFLQDFHASFLDFGLVAGFQDLLCSTDFGSGPRIQVVRRLADVGPKLFPGDLWFGHPFGGVT